MNAFMPSIMRECVNARIEIKHWIRGPVSELGWKGGRLEGWKSGSVEGGTVVCLKQDWGAAGGRMEDWKSEAGFAG